MAVTPMLPHGDPEDPGPRKPPKPRQPTPTPVVTGSRPLIYDENARPSLGSKVSLARQTPNPNDIYRWASTYGGAGLAELASYDYRVRDLVIKAVQLGWSYDQLPFFQTQMNGLGYDTTTGLTGPQSPGSGGRGGGGGGGATVAQNIAAAQAAVRNEQAQLGLGLGDDAILWLATRVVNENWSGDMLTDELVNMGKGKFGNGLAGGGLTAGVDVVKKMANDQLLNISDATAQEYSTRLASQELTMDGLTSLLQEQAKQYYTWAAPTIGKGITMRNYMLPSRDFVANELEMNPEDVDLMDPKWMNMMQVTTDKGEVRAATMPELQQRARADERFKRTGAAQKMTAAAGVYLRDFMEGRA